VRLPNAHRAFIDVEKLRVYALNPTHPEGRHKARVFLAALGISAPDAEWLGGQILAGALESNAAREGFADRFGQRFDLDVGITRGSRSALIRTAWIVRTSEDFPRLITCFAL
jgi:hypothetical protein